MNADDRREAALDRLVRDVARLRGMSERSVRYEYGLLPQPEQWAEEKP